ncbi:MAG: hypothetical protein A2751_00820 [Candidatus Doudnabacteria bacterium RIFCSPHIGHO2_01_FULL_46_14]|uniref:DUF2975 domain-containing protein n=1 Tax=Candidatus Doudnabacteria bacterium RIFCSPHIGHO2_01_FULL_46_14 TaxID=1817824 RepID=A0A1F5NN55_9BACT|nr:MAG: hypothetical protein A2751_00820 [Candidatus Doudnabacteria bacterium RIFCSPHIGHO2_01_FULL_46_14]
MSAQGGSASGGKKGSTWFLRGVLLIMALIALAVGIFAVPAIYNATPKEYPVDINYLRLFVGGLYLSIIPFYVALYQALKLLNFIDHDTAFSEASVSALKTIKYSAIAVSVLHGTAIPFLFQIAELDDAPGVLVLALAFTCAPLVIAVFAAVLEKLLQNAISIKSENDLTV